jgi:putative transposase
VKDKQNIRCKFCKSQNVVKYGYFKNIQRWWCKDCRRKFAANQAMPKMKTAINQVGAAMAAYYEGIPLARIRQIFIRKFDIYVSYSTIFNWINNLSRSASYEARHCHLNFSETWSVIESKIEIRNKIYRCLDIIDNTTQFLLATVICNDINDQVINQLFESARDHTTGFPRKIIIYGSRELIVHTSTENTLPEKSIQILAGLEKPPRLEELCTHFFSKRNIVLSRLRRKAHLQDILDGWIVHYNYFKRNELLNGKTPAQKAGVAISTPD